MADAIPSRPHIPSPSAPKRDTRKQVRIRPGMATVHGLGSDPITVPVWVTDGAVKAALARDETAAFVIDNLAEEAIEDVLSTPD